MHEDGNLSKYNKIKNERNSMKIYLKNAKKTAIEIKSFLSHINILKLSEEKAKLCDKDLTKKDL